MESIRDNFPFLINFQGIYADSACRTPVPRQVLKEMTQFYENFTGCYSKGGTSIISEGDELLEQARMDTAKFIGARSSGEIIWTNGLEDSLNIFINSYSAKFNEKIQILIDRSLNLSLIIPWLYSSLKRKFDLFFIDFDLHDLNNSSKFKELLNSIKPKLVMISYVSHTTGRIYPVDSICKIIHDYQAEILVDFSLALAHTPINVDKQNIDYAIGKFDTSFGPTGIGFIYGRILLLDEIYPIETFEYSLANIDSIETLKGNGMEFKFKKIPERLEGLSKNYSGMIGAAAALNFIKSLNINKIVANEKNLSKSFIEKIISSKNNNYSLLIDDFLEDMIPIFSLNVKTINPHDLVMMLDSEYKIISHAGFLSSSHIFKPLGFNNGIVQFSFSSFNDIKEIFDIVTSLNEIIELFN